MEQSQSQKPRVRLLEPENLKGHTQVRLLFPFPFAVKFSDCRFSWWRTQITFCMFHRMDVFSSLPPNEWILGSSLDHNAIINKKNRLQVISTSDSLLPQDFYYLWQQSLYLNRKSILGSAFPSWGKGSNLNCLEERPRSHRLREQKRPEKDMEYTGVCKGEGRRQQFKGRIWERRMGKMEVGCGYP